MPSQAGRRDGRDRRDAVAAHSPLAGRRLDRPAGLPSWGVTGVPPPPLQGLPSCVAMGTSLPVSEPQQKQGPCF